jgi:peptidoglycan-associated lipoprotein
VARSTFAIVKSSLFSGVCRATIVRIELGGTMRSTLGIGIVLVACGGKPDIGTNQGNVCSQIAEVACYDMYRCCSEGEIERFLNVTDPRTEDQCRDDVTRLCERRLGPVSDSIKNNRAKFDGSIMDPCLKALIAPDNACASVDTMLPWAMACMNDAWTGQVADGSMCVYKFDCASMDSYCATNQTCTALPTNNQPCGPQGCASGFYCGTGTCHPLLGPGGMCTANVQCMKGLFCDFSATTPTCTMLHGPGERCTGNTSCKSNQCLPGTCAGTGTTCFSNTNCGSHCSISGASCFQDSNCGAGHCSITTTKTCFLQTDCLTTDGTCIFPQQCVPGMCVGDVVCADTHLNVDYCTGALAGLPLPPSS